MTIRKILLVAALCLLISAVPLLGRAQEAAESPQRILSMAPNITETVCALGACDRLVGVTDYCTYPPQVRDLPKLGGWFNPNLEALARLEPDLVLLQGRHEKVEGWCRSNSIPTLHVNMDDLDSIYVGIAALGRALAVQQAAEELQDEIRSELDRVRSSIAQEPPVSLFLCTGRTPGSLNSLYTIGGESFLNELTAIASGRNIFAGLDTAYPEVSKESLLKRDPEIIIEVVPQGNADADEKDRRISEWAALRTLRAVREDRIYIVDEEYFLIPGPRVTQTARLLAGLLHRQ